MVLLRLAAWDSRKLDARLLLCRAGCATPAAAGCPGRIPPTARHCTPAPSHCSESSSAPSQSYTNDDRQGRLGTSAAAQVAEAWAAQHMCAWGLDGERWGASGAHPLQVPIQTVVESLVKALGLQLPVRRYHVRLRGWFMAYSAPGGLAPLRPLTFKGLLAGCGTFGASANSPGPTQWQMPWANLTFWHSLQRGGRRALHHMHMRFQGRAEAQ